MRTMDLRTRVTVYCGEKRYGMLRKVVVDPDDGHITDLIVEPTAHATTIRIVPVSLVTRVGVNKVHLGLSADQIDGYPAYPQPADPAVGVNPLDKSGAPIQETRLAKRIPPDSLRPVGSVSRGDDSVRYGRIRVFGRDPPDPTALARFAPGTPVLCSDGQLATVDRVVVDPGTQRLTHLTLRHRGTVAYRVVPVTCTQSGSDGLILAPDTWDKLPAYTPREDAEIYDEVYATVRDRVETAAGACEGLEVTVNGGVVTLLGEMKEAHLLAEVVALVSAIPGVIDLRTDVQVGT